MWRILCQIGGDRLQLPAVVIEEPDAERGGHADAAVIGGAAADADRDMVDAGVERGANQLSSAVRRCGHRLEPILSQ